MNDLISRAAAIEAVTIADRNCLGAHGAREAIRALPAASQPEAEPVVPAEGVTQASAEIRELVKCRCHEAYTRRGMHSPDCNYHYAEPAEILIATALRASQPPAPVSGVTVQEAGWQPIETAPRDGTAILASGLDHGKGPSRHCSVAEWMDFGCESGWYTDEDATPLIYLSHWMPLPEPPVISALEGK